MKRIYTAFGLLIFDVLLLGLTRSIPVTAEFYRARIYPFFLNTLGRFTGIFPWSLAESIICLLVVICAFWMGRGILRTVRKTEKIWKYWKNGLQNLVLGAAVFLTFFSLTEGPNYYGLSFTEQIGMEMTEYSTEELVTVYSILTNRVNTLASEVERDENGIMRVEKGAEKEAVTSIKKLGKTYSQLSGFYPLPKRVLFSQILSLMDITGIYTPFTMEANYNRDIVDYNKPFTMCHELSHLKGYMQEEEANYIAFLACEQSDSLSFQYSGAMLGLIYCGNELYARDRSLYGVLSEKICQEARLDLEENNLYWDTYEGVIASFSQTVNDVYLRVNQQSEGVTSYDRVVDLLVQHLLGQKKEE